MAKIIICEARQCVHHDRFFGVPNVLSALTMHKSYMVKVATNGSTAKSAWNFSFPRVLRAGEDPLRLSGTSQSIQGWQRSL